MSKGESPETLLRKTKLPSASINRGRGPSGRPIINAAWGNPGMTSPRSFNPRGAHTCETSTECSRGRQSRSWLVPGQRHWRMDAKALRSSRGPWWRGLTRQQERSCKGLHGEKSRGGNPWGKTRESPGQGPDHRRFSNNATGDQPRGWWKRLAEMQIRGLVIADPGVPGRREPARPEEREVPG